MDYATVSKLYDAGLKELMKDKLAHELWSDFNHSSLMFPKTIPSLPYEALITLLPKYDDAKIFKTIKNLPITTLHELMQSAHKVLEATREIANADGYHPKSGYIFQHIGPRDHRPKAAFNTSYLPLHFHVQTYGYAIDEFALFQPSQPVSTASREYASLDGESMHIIAKDMLQACGYSITKRGETALEFNQKPLSMPFKRSEATELKTLMASWMQHWNEIAACFTNFSEDAFGRYILFSESHCYENIEQYLKKTPFDFSNQAIKALYNLRENLTDNTNDPWSWTYKGINGAAGYRFDYEQGTRSFIFAPKLYTNSYRHFDIIDENFIITKDKNDTSVVSTEHSQTLLDIQRRIIQKLKNI